MLYINIEINGKKTFALIDSGAEVTVMSEKLCKKCNLFDLCDTKESGEGKGMRNYKIKGIIHAAEIKVENKNFLARINVVENSLFPFILGYNIISTQRCIIDFKKNCIFFSKLGITTKFLSEGEMKKIKEAQEK